MLEPPPPLRIGVLFEYSTMNGGEHSILAVLQHLANHSIIPTILAPQGGKLWTACESYGWRCCSLDLSNLAQRPTELTDQLRALIDREGLELIHANSLSAGRKIGKVVQDLPCPTSSHLRDIISLSSAAITALNQHDGLIAVSQATRDYHLGQGLDPVRSTVVYNGINQDKFYPRPPTGWLHRRLGLKWNDSEGSSQLAAIVGQICLRKGNLDAAEAAIRLKDRIPDLHFVLVGERHSTKSESVEFDQQITKSFEKAGIGNRLHRIGWQDEMESLYPEFQLLIHAARQEPLGRVLLEAAASGIPVVATNVGGTPEIFSHQQSAWLVPPSSPVALAEGIERVMTNPALARQFSQSALSSIQNRFTISLSAANHLRFWKRLTGKEV